MITKGKVEAIYRLMRTHVEKRGLQDVQSMDDLEKAIEELYASEQVMIVTGFLVRDCMVGETDGPIGTVSLAHALCEMEKKVLLLTDTYSQEMITAAINFLKLDIPMGIIPMEDTQAYLEDQIKHFNPTHIVAIERPGTAADGRCYSMKGEDLSVLIPKTDYLFNRARQLGIPTIAIGDGGNELGMGRILDHVKTCVEYGETIASCTLSDHLIVAGVSNWGSYGLVAGLSLRAGRLLMHEEYVEAQLMSAIWASGAVDGVTKRTERSVDGYSFEENMIIFQKIRAIASELC